MDYTDIAVDPKATRERAKVDFDFFAGLALPDVMKVLLPVYYTKIATMLIQQLEDQERIDEVIKFALGLPRGFIKTTFIKVLAAYVIVYDLCDFALVICSTEFHAENMTADIDAILSSPNFTAVYGSWHQSRLIDSKALKRSFYHKRPVILAGLGAGSSLRGINIDNRRPDFLICDDMQTQENDASEAESNRLFIWFVGTLLKAVNLKWCLVVYIGNMYSENCILYKLKKHPQWHSLVTGCILADGQSLWPEMHSVEALFKSFQHDEALGMAHVWFAEMQNDPIQAGTSLLDGALPAYPFPEDTPPDAGFIIIDPAGFRRTSDQNVIAAHHVIDKVGIVAEIVAGRFNPEEVIKETITLILRHNIALVGIEATGYQQTLKFWMDMYLEKAHLSDSVIVIPLETRKRSKDVRIISFFRESQAGNYYIKRPEDRQKVVYQALEYKVGKKNNKDDLLDGCAYGLDIREEYWDQIKLLNNPQEDASFINARVVSNNTPF